MATPGNLKNAVGPNDKTNNNSKEANVAGADFMDLIPTVLSPLGVEGTDTLLICLVAMRVEGNKINSARLTDYWNHATGNDSIPSDMDRCLNGLIERADEIFNKFEKSRGLGGGPIVTSKATTHEPKATPHEPKAAPHEPKEILKVVKSGRVGKRQALSRVLMADLLAKGTAEELAEAEAEAEAEADAEANEKRTKVVKGNNANGDNGNGDKGTV